MKEKQPINEAWERFYNTGSIGAYLMYRAILGELEKKR